MQGDFSKMLAGTPDEVVFNGVAFQYKDHPLPAKVGKRVRLYVVDAGPNFPTAFHVIGGIFETVYPDGDATHALSGVSTYPLAPGQGAVFDIVLAQPGKYPFVDHSMRDMETGAVGSSKTPEGNDRIVSKGAPEALFRKCVSSRLDGKLLPMDHPHIEELKKEHVRHRRSRQQLRHDS